MSRVTMRDIFSLAMMKVVASGTIGSGIKSLGMVAQVNKTAAGVPLCLFQTNLAK